VAYPGGGGATSTGGRGTDIGTAIGTIIGVVIRGGVVDGDHCDPRGTVRRRGGQPGDFPFPVPVAGVPLGGGRAGGGVLRGGISINQRGPVGQPTFMR
jgi:hypothetical protein